MVKPASEISQQPAAVVQGGQASVVAWPGKETWRCVIIGMVSWCGKWNVLSVYQTRAVRMVVDAANKFIGV